MMTTGKGTAGSVCIACTACLEKCIAGCPSFAPPPPPPPTPPDLKASLACKGELKATFGTGGMLFAYCITQCITQCACS